MPKTKTTKRGRDSGTGKFIPVTEAKKKPKTSTVEKVKTPRKRKPRQVNLDDLVASGTISSFDIKTLDCNECEVESGKEGNSSRETQQLTIHFPSGEFLVIKTFCSGCSENTFLLFEKS